MRVYLDPETGEFVPPPEAAPLEAGPEAALQLLTPLEEPVEVWGTTEAGGFTVELNGQFQRPLLFGPPDAEGKLSIRCEHPDRNAD